MRKAWKDLAKRADQLAYTPSDVSAALPRALVSDWRMEVPDAIQGALVQAFSGGDNSLRLPGLGVPAIGELRSLAAASPIASSALAYATQSLSAGRNTPEDLCEVVGRAGIERAEAGARQVEEHYKRKLPDGRRPASVKSRLAVAIAALEARSLGRTLLGHGADAPLMRRATGIDDGVAL